MMMVVVVVVMLRTRTNLFHDLLLVVAEAVKHVNGGGQLMVTSGQVVNHLRSVRFSVGGRRLELMAVAVHDVNAVLLQRLHVANQSPENASCLSDRSLTTLHCTVTTTCLQDSTHHIQSHDHVVSSIGYLNELLTAHIHAGPTRQSSTRPLLTVPHTQSDFARRSFCFFLTSFVEPFYRSVFSLARCELLSCQD